VTDSHELRTHRLRAARNQSLRRKVNARIFELGGFSAFTEYVCECPLRACGAHVSLAVDEYLEIRRDPTHFVVVPGHRPTADRIVRETDRYRVVEKSGDAGRLAARSAQAPGRHG
jgi:hypothetical protein